MTTINQRVEKLMHYHNLNSNTLGRKLNMTGMAVLFLVNGKTKTINNITIKRIVNEFPRVSIKWLVLGEGEMFSKEEIVITEKTVDEIIKDDIKHQISDHMALFHKIYSERLEELEEKIRGLTKDPSD